MSLLNNFIFVQPKRLPFEGESFTSSPTASNIEDSSSQLDDPLDGPLDWMDEDMNIDEFESQPNPKSLKNDDTVEIKKDSASQLEIQEANMLKKDAPQIRFLLFVLFLTLKDSPIFLCHI